MIRILSPFLLATALAFAPALATAQQGKTQPNQSVKKSCADCGRVEGIRVLEQSDWKKYAAPVAGAVVGGVVGNQFGGGTGKTIFTVVGALGGAYGGHKVEEKTRDKVWEVIVRMDDGTRRTVTLNNSPGVREGDRVRVRDGRLVLVEQ
jgi:outer membrane lipoprotein SlyB